MDSSNSNNSDDNLVSVTSDNIQPLKYFDLTDIEKNSTIVIIAYRGHEHITKPLINTTLSHLYETNKINECIIISPTEKYDSLYKNMASNIYRSYDTKILHEIVENQKQQPSNHVAIVLDNCLGSNWKKDTILTEIICNGRNYNITLIIVAQYPPSFSPEIRDNIDYTFITYNNYPANVTKIFDHYAKKSFPSYKSFTEVFEHMEMEMDSEMIIIHNNGHKHTAYYHKSTTLKEIMIPVMKLQYQPTEIQTSQPVSLILMPDLAHMDSSNNNSDDDITSENNTPLEYFDLRFIDADPTIVIIANMNHEDQARTLIKSTLSHLYETKKIDECIIISPAKNSVYVNISCKVYDDTKIITKILETQRHRIETNCINMKHVAVVLDNCLESNWKDNSEAIQELCMNSNSYRITLIIRMMYPHDIPPDVRYQFDYTFMAHNCNMKSLYNYYAQVFPSYNLFNQTISQINEDSEMLTIVGTHKIYLDKAYYYKNTPNEEIMIPVIELLNSSQQDTETYSPKPIKFKSDDDTDTDSDSDIISSIYSEKQNNNKTTKIISKITECNKLILKKLTTNLSQDKHNILKNISEMNVLMLKLI